MKFKKKNKQDSPSSVVVGNENALEMFNARTKATAEMRNIYFHVESNDNVNRTGLTKLLVLYRVIYHHPLLYKQ